MIVESMMPRTRIDVLACLLVASMGQASAAEPADPPTELAVSQGRCVDVVVADKPAACVKRPGIIQVRYRSGRSVVMIGLTGRAAIAFVADSERSAGPQETVLDLARVRIGKDGAGKDGSGKDGAAPAVPVTGSCRVKWSPDGTAWTDVACDARDDQGKTYRLLFQPSGKLEVERS
jgi:hypothetical protein